MTVKLTVTELAKLLELSKAGISKRAKKLYQQHPGDWIDFDANGRIVAIDAARYQHLTGHVGDSSKRPDAVKAHAPAATAQPDGAQVVNLNSMDEAKRLKAWIDKSRAEIEFAEKCGHLVRADRLEEALDDLGAEIARIIDMLPNKADEVAQAQHEDGIKGIRRALRDEARRLREQIAQRLLTVAADAPETDGDDGVFGALAAQ